MLKETLVIHPVRTLLFLIILIITFSCHIQKNIIDAEADHNDICDSKLLEYKNKYGFIHSLDSLRKIQPCVSDLMSDKYEEVINRSLFVYIKKYYLVRLEESEYDLFYKHKGTSVALYNYLFESEEVEAIENGIKIKNYNLDK